MAYTAIYEGEERGAFEVPHKTDAYCLECGERMRVWREADDGTARHFKHIRNMKGSTGYAGEHDCSGGESDEHRKWKNFAAERASEEFENIAEVSVEKRFSAPHTEKQYRDADSAVIFQDRDEQLGIGLAIEVQHRNLDKDIRSTTKDYLKQDIAVAWLRKEDFTDKGCKLNEVDFRDRARQSASISLFAPPVPWYLHVETHVEPELELLRSELSGHVPAKIPSEYFDKNALEMWESAEWQSLFRRYKQDEYLASISNKKCVDSEIPLWEWIRKDGYPKKFKRSLKRSYRAGVEQIPKYEKEKIEASKRVLSIIKHNTGGPQPESIGIESIKTIYSYNNCNASVESGIEELIQDGIITETTTGRYSL